MNSTAPPHPAFKTTLHRARALRTPAPACSPGPPGLWQRHRGRPALHEGWQSGEAARCGGPGHLLGATCSSSLPWGGGARPPRGASLGERHQLCSYNSFEICTGAQPQSKLPPESQMSLPPDPQVTWRPDYPRKVTAPTALMFLAKW